MSQEETGKTSAANPTGYQKKSVQDSIRAIAQEREEKSKKLRAELSQYREETRKNVRQLLSEFQTNRRIGVRKQAASSAPANVLPEEQIPPEKSLSTEKVAIAEERVPPPERATTLLKDEITTAEEIQGEEQSQSGGEDLDSRILQVIISASPEGIAISGIRKQIDAPRKKLSSALRKLVEDGKIRRKNKDEAEGGSKYFTITSDQQQGERRRSGGEA